jgi:transcriptional regulator with XRE-family HTH domain
MATRERAIDRADQDTRRSIASIGREIREARRAAGISQTFVGAKVGLSHTQVSRVERGLVLGASVRVLGRLCRTVGLELAVRAYPGGDAVRDLAQLRLLERLRSRIHPSLLWVTEVPLPQVGDKRAWDALVSGPGWSLAVEAETRLSDIQALTRRLELKRRDGGILHMIMLVADTRTNRAALLGARSSLADGFPLGHGAILGALARGVDPGGSGIVIL